MDIDMLIWIFPISYSYHPNGLITAIYGNFNGEDKPLDLGVIHFHYRAVQYMIWVSFKVSRGTLWLFNIAVENGPFIDDFPI